MAVQIRVELDGDYTGLEELQSRFKSLGKTLTLNEEQLQQLERTLSGLSGAEIDVDASSIESAAKSAGTLQQALDGINPDGLRSTIAAAESLETQTSDLIRGFSGTADSLADIVTAAQNANKVVRDLLSAETQSSSLLRQTRASIEVLEGLSEQTDNTRKRIAELREEEERLATEHRQLSTAAEKASKSARTLAAAADRAQTEVDGLGDEADTTATKIAGLNRAAEKNRLAVLNRGAAQSRRELRAAAGASADFIASMDRMGASAVRNAGQMNLASAAAGGMAGNIRQQMAAAEAATKRNRSLAKATEEISQAVAVNSVVGNNLVNALQRVTSTAGAAAAPMKLLTFAVIAGFGAMEIWERVAKSSGDEAKELEGRVGELGKEFHDTTGELGGFGKALDAAFADRNKSGLTDFLADTGDLLRDLKETAGEWVDAMFPDSMSENIERNRDALFGISEAEREAAKQAELRAQAQQRSGIIGREVATALQEDEVKNLATVEEVTARIEQIERTLADERLRQNKELVEQLAKQEGQLAERLVELRLEERQAERDAVDESKKLQAERAEAAKEALSDVRDEFGKFTDILADREASALDELIEKRDELKGLAADEAEIAQQQARIVEHLTEQYDEAETAVRSIQDQFIAATKYGTTTLELQEELAERQKDAVANFAAVSRQLDAEQKRQQADALAAERAVIDKRREGHEDRLKQLAEIRQTERDLLDLLTGQNMSTDERIAAESQLDELLLKRDAILKRTNDQSAAALENEKAIREEITETADKYLQKLSDQKQKLEDLIASGKGQTQEARELREEYEASVAVLTELKTQQDKLNDAKANSVAQAEVTAFDARVSAIENFLSQRQQGGQIKGQIGSQVSDRDVNQEFLKQRQAELDGKLPEVLQDVVRKLAEKGIDARVEDGRVVAAEQRDRAAARRAERQAVDAARRQTFRRPASDSERITAREGAISKKLDEIAAKGGGKETVDVLRQQLDTEADQLRTQAETRDAITDLADAINSQQKPQANAQPEQQQMTPQEFQQRQRAAQQGQQQLEQSIGLQPIATGAKRLTTATGANLNAQAELAEAVGAGFEAVSQAQSEQANQLVQLASYVGTLAEHIGVQTSSLRSAVSQNMSRGSAALRTM